MRFLNSYKGMKIMHWCLGTNVQVQNNKMCKNEWHVKKDPILMLVFYSNRADFLLLVRILTAIWAYSGVTNPTRCQCQPRNCQQINTSGNGAETLQHPSKAFADHFWSEGCIKCHKGCIDVVDIWETGVVLNQSKCKFEKVNREKYTHL